MKIRLKILMVLALLILLPKPAVAAGSVSEALCMWVPYALAVGAAGCAATYYSYQEQEKKNPDTEKLSLASTVMTPIAVSSTLFFAGVGISLTSKNPHDNMAKSLAIAALAAGSLATAFYTASAVTSGIAFRYSDNYSTVRAFALNLSAAVLSFAATVLTAS